MTDNRRDGLTRALPDDLPIDFTCPPPSHSREEPAGLSDPAPVTGEPAPVAHGEPGAGSGGGERPWESACQHVVIADTCVSCGESGFPDTDSYQDERWEDVPVGAVHLGRGLFAKMALPPSDPAAPPPQGPAGSLVAQAEAVGIRPIPGAASGWREAVAELRTELGIRLMAFPDGARVHALELRLDQASEAWTLGVATLTERVRALGDGLRFLEEQVGEVAGARLGDLEDQVTRIANRVSALGVPAGAPDAELAVYRERERCVRLALAVHEYELAARIAAGVGS